MFKIGDFSKLSRVSVKTLRYYDEIGLLKPIGVDRFTRYRFYALDQLPRLYRILGLKELGFSLEQVRRLLEGDLTGQQLKAMLEGRRAEIQAQMDVEGAQIRQIEARLKEIEMVGRFTEYEIVLKKIEPVWVAAVKGEIPSYDESEPIFDRLFDEVYDYVRLQGVRNPGCGIAIYHEPPEPGGESLVEAAAQLAAPVPASQQVAVYQLPGMEQVASVIHHGPFATIGAAYQALLTWTQQNGYRSAGPVRELYLRYQRGGDQINTITEIQYPVRKVKETKMDPKIVNVEKFYAVGMPYIGKNENNEIGQMWTEFNRRFAEIQNVTAGSPAYGLCFSHPQGMEYVAAFRVDSLEDIPPGMVGKEVPSQTYAVFPVNDLSEIGQVYRQINQDWLPGSGYRMGDGPDFELYNEEFNPQTDEGVFYIYYPVKQ